MKTIELVLKKQNYRIQKLGEGLCDEGTDAWTLPGGIGLLTQSFITIRICDPEYFNDSFTEQAATIIHEAAHIGLSAGDLAYDWSPEYEELNTIQQMLNADSFSEISKCLCP